MYGIGSSRLVCWATYVKREVAALQRGEQHDRRDERGAEAATQRVLRRLREAAAARVRAPEAGDDRVEREPEADDERCPPELRHGAGSVFLGTYFDGHFVTSVPGTATKTPFA